MSTVSYVKQVCCTSYYHIKNIASIRSCLTQKAAVSVLYYLVISTTSCICSSRLPNIASTKSAKCCHRWEHIAPVFLKLYWLPVKKRFHKLILLLKFRTHRGLAPPYITDLLEQTQTITNNYLYVPPSRSRYDDRMFSVGVPRLRNSLPNEMKKTCRLLTCKTSKATYSGLCMECKHLSDYVMFK